MTTELVPVFAGEIQGQSVQLVDARLLHAFLEVGKRFASWIVERIEEYSFVQDQDYIAISQKREIGHGRGKTDYHLTLDMAKELAMVERNERGREARRYFIECERRIHQPETARRRLPSGAPAALPEELPKELRTALNRKAHALSLKNFDALRGKLEAQLRAASRFRTREQLVHWIEDYEEPAEASPPAAPSTSSPLPNWRIEVDSLLLLRIVMRLNEITHWDLHIGEIHRLLDALEEATGCDWAGRSR